MIRYTEENALAAAVDTSGANIAEREALYTLVLDERFGPACYDDHGTARAAVARALFGIRGGWRVADVDVYELGGEA